MTDKPYALERDAFSLMRDEPFYARIFARIDKTATTGIPTAGVRFNKEKLRFELVYNPTFMGSLSRAARIDVLKHEGAHIFLDHCTSRTVAEEHHRMWNIATDLAINSYLENLPEGCCMPGVGPFEKYPLYQSAEWYFNKLKQDGEPEQEQGEGEEGQGEGQPGQGEGQPGEGQGQGQSGNKIDDYQFDSHEGWTTDEVSEAEREVARERMRDIVRDAVEECDNGKGWGSVSAPMRAELRKNFKRQTINWRSVLRMFVQSSQPSKRRSSIRRLSRRYPWVHPGRRTDKVANIAISIDQSGSVSSQELQVFYNELEGLAKLANFTVIPFDDKVFEEGITEWKRGETHKWR